MSLLTDYLQAVRTIHVAPSTPELLFYNALADLLNDVGKSRNRPILTVGSGVDNFVPPIIFSTHPSAICPSLGTK